MVSKKRGFVYQPWVSYKVFFAQLEFAPHAVENSFGFFRQKAYSLRAQTLRDLFLGLFASIIQDSGGEHHCFLAGRKSFSPPSKFLKL